MTRYPAPGDFEISIPKMTNDSNRKEVPGPYFKNVQSVKCW
jgi:hypothetical protein